MCFAGPSASSGPLARSTGASPHSGIQLLLSSRASIRVNSLGGRPKTGEGRARRGHEAETAARPWGLECGLRAPGLHPLSLSHAHPGLSAGPGSSPPLILWTEREGDPETRDRKGPGASPQSSQDGLQLQTERSVPSPAFLSLPVCFHPPAPCLSPMAGAPLASHDWCLPRKDKPLNCCQIR